MGYLILRIRMSFFLVALLLLTACTIQPKKTEAWQVEGISVYSSGYDKGTEIISVQQSTLRAVLSNFDTGEVDLLDIRKPSHIQRLQRFSLGLTKDEELTAVAFHPTLDLFAAIIDAGIKPGRLEIRSASTGKLLDQVNVGYGPDAVVFSKSGELALVANEGEDFSFDKKTQQFITPEGSVSLLHLNQNGRIKTHTILPLADMTNHEGFVIDKHGRYLERAIDWNGNGKIDKTLDFDGNNHVDKKKVKLGYFHGREVFGNENKGESKILIPITDYSPSLLEPEYIAITPDTAKAYVTLQEDDGVAVIDLTEEKVISYFGLGVTHHQADAKNDGWIDFKTPISGIREPDGIAVTGDGRFFITADEGDTINEDNAEGLVSGGRSVSVFDVETGRLVGDTDNQVDTTAFKNLVYPELRSNKKGSEPEMLISFEIEGEPLIAAGLERAGAVELISLANPTKPRVVALGKLAGDEVKSPEGIAYFQIGEEHYLLTANETSGTVECFKVSRQDAR